MSRRSLPPGYSGDPVRHIPPRHRHPPLHLHLARRSGTPRCMWLSTCRNPHRRSTRGPMDCSMRGPPPKRRYASICPHGSQGCKVHRLQTLWDWHYKPPLENEAIWIWGTVAVVRVRVRESLGVTETYRKWFLGALKRARSVRSCNSAACVTLTFVGLDQRSNGDGASDHARVVIADVGNRAMNVDWNHDERRGLERVWPQNPTQFKSRRKVVRNRKELINPFRCWRGVYKPSYWIPRNCLGKNVEGSNEGCHM